MNCTNEELELIKVEYIKLHELISLFDEKLLKIKGWSITVSSASIGAAFISKIPLLLLLASFSAIVFWYIEYLWKGYQKPYYFRMLEIEGFFKSSSKKIVPFQIGNTWRENSTQNFPYSFRIKTFLTPSVMIPHILVSGVFTNIFCTGLF